jgi:hypothetical protein
VILDDVTGMSPAHQVHPLIATMIVGRTFQAGVSRWSPLTAATTSAVDYIQCGTTALSRGMVDGTIRLAQTAAAADGFYWLVTWWKLVTVVEQPFHTHSVRSAQGRAADVDKLSESAFFGDPGHDQIAMVSGRHPVAGRARRSRQVSQWRCFALRASLVPLLTDAAARLDENAGPVAPGLGCLVDRSAVQMR